MRDIILLAVLVIHIRMYSCHNCTCTTFFPHGSSAGDTFVYGDDRYGSSSTVSAPFVYFGASYYRAYVSTNSIISFVTGNSAFSTKCDYPKPSAPSPALFIYWMDLDERSVGDVTFRMDDDPNLLYSIDTIIQGCTGDTVFTSNISLVATWYMIQKHPEQHGTEFTFQATLATNGVETYMITSYENMTSSGAGIGGQNATQTEGFNHPYSCHYNTDDILTSSNFGCPGQYIVKISDPNPTYGTLRNGTLVCQSNPCENGAPCVDTIFGYTCACVDGFDGQNCENALSDQCLSNPCENNSTCVDVPGNYTCVCTDGFEGHDCEIDIDDCQLDPCEHNATCIDEVGNYTCNCTDGYEGYNCETNIDDCIQEPCANNATCVDAVNNYTCVCADGFEGHICEIDIDECLSDPCENNATCVYEIDNYTCTCIVGYEGRNCETDIDDCIQEPCENNATCVDAVNNYTCVCADGFEGHICQIDIDECLSDPCENNATCVDEVDDYTCNCLDGYEGRNCETDIDDCLLKPCENNSTCVDAVNNFTCGCLDGFEGRHCETDIDDCITSACKHGSTCVDAINNYTCTCANGYTGRDCEIDINECKSQPCQNGATCSDDINSYSCQCKGGWSGTDCEIDINECSNSPCMNGGSCKNTPGSFKCTCTEEWAGTNCQIELILDPEVNSASPNKGPVAGGTRITVRGKHLPASDPIFVYIGTLDCLTTQKNKTTVIALTPPVNESDTSLVGVDLPVSVGISGGKVFSLTENFVFKGNPKIESFKPTATIVKGGTQITVSGEDLDAVAAPAVTIIVTYYKAISKDPIEYDVTTTTYEAPCQVKDVTEMQCQTPQIELPEDFKIDTDSVSDINDNDESRRKRSTDNFEYQSGDDKLAFHVGFKLDGVKDFENFSSIDVYPEPTFNFDQGSGDRVFQYKAGERLRFPGDNLDVGVLESDYRIDIGKAVCGSLELLTNSLSCAPPGEKPPLDTSNLAPNPKIIINVGLNVQHLAGYLEYPDTKQLHIVIPATVLSIIVIITLILTACLLRRNRKQKQTRPQKAKRVSVFNGQDDYYQYHEHHTSRYVKEPTNRIVPRRSTIHPMFCDPYHMMVTHNHRYRDHVHPKGLPRQDELQDDVRTGHIVKRQGLLKRETVHNKNNVDKYCRDQRLPRQDISHKRNQEPPRQDAINSSINNQGLPRTATKDNEQQEMCSMVNLHRETNNGLPRYNRHPDRVHQRQTHQRHRRSVVINDNVIAYQDVDLDNFVPPPPPPPPLPPPLRHDTEFYSRQLDRIH